MGGVIGLTLLVCVSAVGLVHLALRRPPVEHRVGSMFVVLIAFSMILAAPFAAVLMMLCAAWTRRLVPTVQRVDTTAPDFVPPNWM